jgi:hypothetical protein
VGNNIRVFLLFGGFVCHSAKRHRLKPAAFDMSVFGSKHIEPYIMDFLQVCCLVGLVCLVVWLLVLTGRSPRSCSSVLVVPARLAAAHVLFVLAGLRRVRAQTNAKAKTESLQKPLHAQWLSWPECQQVRRACQAAFHAKEEDGKEGKREKSKSAARLLKSLVCLLHDRPAASLQHRSAAPVAHHPRQEAFGPLALRD